MNFDFSALNFETIDSNINAYPDMFLNQNGVTFTKKVLEDLGYPAFVLCLLDAKARVFAIRSCKSNEPKGFKFSKPRGEQKRKVNSTQAVLSSKKAPKHDKKEAQHHDIDVMLGFDLVPFLSQEEIADIPMFNPISAHIELIERNNVLREVVADRVIRAELAVDRFVGGEQIAHLNVQLFAALVAYKINFLIARSANGHFIAPAQQFQIFRFYYNCRMAGDRFFAADRSEPQ